MAYLNLNGINLEVKRTWIFEAKLDDPLYMHELDGERCVELISADERYRLVTTMDAIAERLT